MRIAAPNVYLRVIARMPLDAPAPAAEVQGLLLATVPASAFAAISYTLDIKAHPSVFKANTVVDVPLYFVETRAATDTSQLVPGSTLRNVRADFYSSHSKFLGLSLVPAFDEDGCDLYCINKIQYVNLHQNGLKSSISFNAQSKTGVPITGDNSGITGRTEVYMGTLKIQVGPVVDVGAKKLVFDAVFHDDPIGGNIIVPTIFGPDRGTRGLSNMVSKPIQVFNDDVVPEGIAPGDGTPSTPTTPAAPAPPAIGIGEPASATSPSCGTAKAALTKATTTVKKAKKLATSTAKADKKAPTAKQATARKKAKQAQTAQKQQTTAQRVVRTVC